MGKKTLQMETKGNDYHMNEKREVIVKTAGTCGELVQGMMNNSSFLITCPINLFSYVKVGISRISNEITCHPSMRWKSKKAARETLKFLNEKNINIDLRIRSDIPLGKGMASSTADIVGSCLGIVTLLNKKISESEIAGLALSIEPSDGTMFKGIVLFDYLKGSVVKHLGVAPPMKIVAIDIGGTINTIRFNKNDYKKIRSVQERGILKAVELVEKGIKEKNCFLIGEGATLSAVLNQQILFKKELNEIIEISKELNAYGVCVAHSGTVIGILLPIHFEEMAHLKKMVINRLNNRYKFHEVELINGGICDEIDSKSVLKHDPALGGTVKAKKCRN